MFLFKSKILFFTREDLFANIEKAPLKIPNYISADAASLLKCVIILLNFENFFLN